ncbi:MAG: hypothetical protein ABIH66_03345 [bacterium]
MTYNIAETEQIEDVVRGLVYGILSNNATYLKAKFKKTAHNFPDEWKVLLKKRLTEQRHHDEDYVDEVLPLLEAD